MRRSARSTPRRIVASRVRTHRLLGPRADDPEEVVRDLLAVQAQDHRPALWSIAMRTRQPAVDVVADAYERGRLLRTHVLRQTWHLVHVDDLRWLLALTAPRIHQRNGTAYRQLGLDRTTLDRSTSLLDELLAGGPLPRAEVATALGEHGVDVSGSRLTFLLMYAELEQACCSGPSLGGQRTYARFDDRVPPGVVPDRDTMLTELVVRFLTGHGPSLAADVATWSSLTLGDIATGIDRARDGVAAVEVDGRTFHRLATHPTPARLPSRHLQLLQPYDELLSGSFASRDLHAPRIVPAPTSAPRFNAVVLVGGRVEGSWRAVHRRGNLTIEVATIGRFDDDHRAALRRAADRYAAALDRSAGDVHLEVSPHDRSDRSDR